MAQAAPPLVERPTVGCLPFHEWLEHFAGFHLPNGDFSQVVNGRMSIAQAMSSRSPYHPPE